MSDNEDLLADDLGDHSLADYNLGNEEEEQLLADDYENGAPQNVPAPIANYAEPEMVAVEYPVHEMPFNPQQPMQYQMPPEPECVVPNITVEVPNASLPEHSTYAPYEPPPYEIEHAVPPAIPAVPMESPQIVPSDMPVSLPSEVRERFPSERPAGGRAPRVARDIPDSLDKVVLPRGSFPPRGRTSWRHPQYRARFHHNQYRRNNMHRGNFQHRPQFPPPQMRQPPPQMQPELPRIPGSPPRIRPEPHLPPQIPPDLPPERPMLESFPQDIRPPFPNQNRFFRPNLDARPNFGPMRPNFDRPMFYRPRFNPRQFPPLREVVPNSNHLPQVTIRHGPPGPPMNMGPNSVNMVPNPVNMGPNPVNMGPNPVNMGPKQQEVRMLPVQLPPNIPGLAGKKVLINPHFKGNFQPVDGLPLPAYIPTRIQKSPPLSPTLENKFGAIKDIDDAAERFIAEQRSALARAAGRKPLPAPRREPQRFIENTTIEIENELAHSSGAPSRNSDDDELLRRQEEFINANRAGLRRRMRSPSPPSPPPARRSPSPRRSPERRARVDARPPSDEDSEYRRRMREQESLRERVLRAKEARRRKNAVASQKQQYERERERIEKEKDRPAEIKLPETRTEPAISAEDVKPDTTRKSPEREKEKETVREKEIVKERSPIKEETVNSTCENLTPPRAELPKESPERALTPPLPTKLETKTETKLDSDDDLDLILGDIDGILSDDEDTGRFKDKSSKTEPPKTKPQVDLRTKLPPKTADTKREKPQRQKIIFQEEQKEERKKKEITPPKVAPPKRGVVTSSTKTDDSESSDKKYSKTKDKSDVSTIKSRPRITFDHKKEQEKEKSLMKEEPKSTFTNRRVILQRKANPKEKSVFARIEIKTDPAKPHPGIFSRAVRTAIGSDNSRIVIKKQDDPPVEYESDSDIDENKLLEEEIGNIAVVENLPHGMTDTRLKTLAGADVQSLLLDKEERSAKLTFKTTLAAETFKRKFNNKMVAASRLSVTLR